MTSETLLRAGLLLSVLAPALLAAALTVRPWRDVLRRIVPWAALPSLLLSLFAPDGRLEFPWLLLGVELGLDETGRAFLFFTSILWLTSGLYSVEYLCRDTHRIAYFACYLLSMSGNLGLVLARDLISFYFLFTLMSFAAYGLVIHYRNGEAFRAGRFYIYCVLIGEVLLLTGLFLVVRDSGNHGIPALNPVRNGLALALLFLGFGIKAGALPLHVWLPLAHPVAPTPASAVLSGAMINAGLIGWLRFLPLGSQAWEGWGKAILLAGVIAAFYGVVVGLVQTNPKTVLAYSSISQMGVMTLGIGLGLMAPERWPALLPALLCYAMHHGLAKGALFLGVDAVAFPGKDRRWRQTLLLVPALALVNAPLTSGALAKTALASGWGGMEGFWSEARIGWLLALSSVATTLLTLRFLALVWPEPKPAMRSGQSSCPRARLFPWLILIAAGAGGAWLWSWGERLAWPDGRLATAWGSTWPVLVGAMIFAHILTWLRKRNTGGRPGVTVPPGDWVVVWDWVMAWKAWKLLWDVWIRLVETGRVKPAVGIIRIERMERALPVEPAEDRLRSWTLGSALFLVLLLILFVLLLLT